MADIPIRLKADESLKSAAHSVAMEDATRALLHAEAAVALLRVWAHECKMREQREPRE